MTHYNIIRSGTGRLLTACLLMLCDVLLTGSCHKEYDDYYTTANVVIVMPEGYVANQLQGTVTLTNLNSRQTYSTASFNGASASLEVLRGVYSAQVEGSLRYTDSEGNVQRGNFRAATSHCEVLTHPAEIKLDIIFL